MSSRRSSSGCALDVGGQRPAPDRGVVVDPDVATWLLPGDRLARAALTDGVGRADTPASSANTTTPADRDRVATILDERGGSGGREVGAGVERADRGGGPGGVVVVELLVGAVVDVAGLALGLEIVERAQQEVTLRLERLAVELAHVASSVSSSRRLPLDDVDVVGGRREARA